MERRQVCSHCCGPFGMVTHRWWGSKFCSRTCKEAYLREVARGRDVLMGGLGLRRATRGRSSTSRGTDDTPDGRRQAAADRSHKALVWST